MKNAAIVFPWVLVAVLLAIFVAQFRSSDSDPEKTSLSSSTEETDQRAIDPDGVDLAERVESLNIENESLREIVTSQAEQIDTLNAALSETVQPAVGPRDSKPASDAQLAEDRRAMAEQFAEMRLERRYGAFLAGIGLDPGREEAVRSALLQVLTDAPSNTGSTDGEYAAWMREELAQILSPEELAEFDQYQDELPEQMLRQSFASQVNSMAAGLSDETRAVLVDVLVAEALIADQIPAPENATAAYPLIQRMNVYANTADRFEGVLNERESAAMNRFLNQQYAQLETTVGTIERAEAAGATTLVDVRDGVVRVEIDQRN